MSDRFGTAEDTDGPAADEAAAREGTATGGDAGDAGNAGAAGEAAEADRALVAAGIAGVVFDCDGILVDSEQPWLDLMARWLRTLGISGFPPEAMRGMTGAEAAAALRRAHVGGTRPAPPEPQEIDRAYSEALAGLAAPMPGAPELVRALAGTVPVAVASNGRREDVHGLLERVGVLDLFDVVVTVEDVEHGKPDPAPYLLAARRLGVDPHRTVAFEDSVLGSQAARAAGCTVVGVNEDLTLPLVADVRLSSMREIVFDAETRTMHAAPARGPRAAVTAEAADRAGRPRTPGAGRRMHTAHGTPR